MDKHLIQAAKVVGWSDLQLQMASPAELDRLAAFYRLAYRQGMERAAEICTDEGLYCTAQDIRTEAHAKNQPESTHDTGNV